MSKIFPNLKSSLVLVKPEIVIGWHKKSFNIFWTIKSRKSESPKISLETIALIRKIHKQNPLLSPEKIYERLVGIICHELLVHIIPLNQRHLKCLIQEYIQNYYNPVRTHKGIDCQTHILKEMPPETSIANTSLTSESILGGLYHSYRKVA